MANKLKLMPKALNEKHKLSNPICSQFKSKLEEHLVKPDAVVRDILDI